MDGVGQFNRLRVKRVNASRCQSYTAEIELKSNEAKSISIYDLSLVLFEAKFFQKGPTRLGKCSNVYTPVHHDMAMQRQEVRYLESNLNRTTYCTGYLQNSQGQNASAVRPNSHK